jgi:hypothetical protein
MGCTTQGPTGIHGNPHHTFRDMEVQLSQPDVAYISSTSHPAEQRQDDTVMG